MQEFERCPFGITGLETAIGLALSELVHKGKITVMRMIELFTTGPAGVLQLDRGTLQAGAPGDDKAVAPRGPDLQITDEDRNFWAFQTPVRPKVPDLKTSSPIEVVRSFP